LSIKRKLATGGGGFLIVLLLLVTGFYFAIKIEPPQPDDLSPLQLQRKQLADEFYSIGNNKLKHSQSGLWEMYVEGAPFERGVLHGKLAKELLDIQEKYFVEQINQLIPSPFYLRFLKYFIGWFNRHLDEHVPLEYLLEIYGVSLSASDEYTFIAPNYQRMLNYHAAHDIGHALQGMAMVGCTSFGVWDGKAADKGMLIGRNFDFYVGDGFAENKIVCFIKPRKGYPHMMVTWGGMIGAVSGMNTEGLTVTLNAAASKPPLSAATPISLLAREILQHASNIEEAYAIAQNRETFVSESILIGSANDGQAAIIEKTPDKIGLYLPDDNYLICSNHFQSETFAADVSNIENIRNTDSPYRFTRMQELLSRYPTVDATEAATILRNQQGAGDKNIGMGNPKAINQMIAHHSIIFKPEELLVWVSTSPWQLGEYVAYNLSEVFSNFPNLNENIEITEPDLTIAPDSFLQTEDFQQFLSFRATAKQLKARLKEESPVALTTDEIAAFTQSNPNYYYTYELLGDYLTATGSPAQAAEYYRQALQYEIPTTAEAEKIKGKLF